MADKSPEVIQAQRNPDQEGDTRCVRNDGKVWRCKNLRVQGNRFCENHVKSVNGGASKAPKRRHSTSDIAPPEKRPRRSTGLGIDGAPGESDDSQNPTDSHDAARSLRKRKPKFQVAEVVNNHPRKDPRRKTISGEMTIGENKEKVMHLNGKAPKEEVATKSKDRKETPAKGEKKEPEKERGSDEKVLKVYKKEPSTNGKVNTNGHVHYSQKGVKKEEKVVVADVVSSQRNLKAAVESDNEDSDESFEKQVTRGRRQKEVRRLQLRIVAVIQ